MTTRDFGTQWAVAGLAVAAIAIGIAAKERPGSLGAIHDQKLVQGCGCSFSQRTAKTGGTDAMVLGLEYGGAVWANIDGHDVPLRTLKSLEECDLSRTDSRCTAEYVHGDDHLKVDLVVTSVCPEGDAACEVTRLSGSIRVVRHGEEIQVVEVQGACGC